MKAKVVDEGRYDKKESERYIGHTLKRLEGLLFISPAGSGPILYHWLPD